MKAALKYADDGKLLLLVPKDIGGMKTLTKEQTKIDAMCRRDYEDAKAIKSFF